MPRSQEKDRQTLSIHSFPILFLIQIQIAHQGPVSLASVIGPTVALDAALALLIKPSDLSMPPDQTLHYLSSLPACQVTLQNAATVGECVWFFVCCCLFALA